MNKILIADSIKLPSLAEGNRKQVKTLKIKRKVEIFVEDEDFLLENRNLLDYFKNARIATNPSKVVLEDLENIISSTRIEDSAADMDSSDLLYKSDTKHHGQATHDWNSISRKIGNIIKRNPSKLLINSINCESKAKKINQNRSIHKQTQKWEDSLRIYKNKTRVLAEKAKLKLLITRHNRMNNSRDKPGRCNPTS